MRFSMMIIKLSHQKDEKILLPLSITVHHSTTDGYHVSCFIDDIQKMCFDTKIWLY
ncbi:CatA-like O-acetyltransferase [Clostridioides sp. ZZV14-6345]|uniref:CatA-like O-acetyltransferase n=1 Tax=Clostridioides sp. ZZV14-6345 TaxID=2811496 RepID=UPI0039BD3FF0